VKQKTSVSLAHPQGMRPQSRGSLPVIAFIGLTCNCQPGYLSANAASGGFREHLSDANWAGIR
jgi:hypothetical protein